MEGETRETGSPVRSHDVASAVRPVRVVRRTDAQVLLVMDEIRKENEELAKENALLRETLIALQRRNDEREKMMRAVMRDSSPKR